MSGGNWDYRNDILCGEIFGYCIENTKEARRANPLEDVLISGIVFDVFKLLHAYDWYACGDTGESDYREAVSAFKDKYLKTNDGYGKDIVKKIVDEQICQTKEELYKTFNIDERTESI